MKKSETYPDIEILPEMIGLRLDKALGLLKMIATRSRAESLIRNGHVFINGKIARSSHKVLITDRVTLVLPKEEETDIQPLKLELDVLFEDKDLIVLNKPSGLVVHPGAGHSQDTLVNALFHHTRDLSMKFGENRPGIVHRLDRDTSGILVVAKNDFSHEKLALQFKNKTAHRIYFAICVGAPKASKGQIMSFLARHPTDRKKFASVLGPDRKIHRVKEKPPRIGKWAVTNYEVVEQKLNGLTLMKLKLETGRTHQIRVHLAEMGCPILADPIYGKKSKYEFPRLGLHAAELGFQHPTTHEELLFSVDWPSAEKQILLQFGFK